MYIIIKMSINLGIANMSRTPSKGVTNRGAKELYQDGLVDHLVLSRHIDQGEQLPGVIRSQYINYNQTSRRPWHPIFKIAGLDTL